MKMTIFRFKLCLCPLLILWVVCEMASPWWLLVTAGAFADAMFVNKGLN